MGPPSLPPSFPPLPPSLHPPPLFLGLAWFAPPCLCSYCKFLQHQQCLFHRHTFCGGAGEVPSGRPRTFCGGRGGTRWPPPNLLWGGRGGTQWRPPHLLWGKVEGGRAAGREQWKRGIVTASLCWSQPHSQTPRDTSLSLGVCEWGCDQHKLAVTIYLSIAPSLSPSLPSFPPFSPPSLPPSLPSLPSLPPSIPPSFLIPCLPACLPA